jgi:predicted phage-related endonuclease
MNQQESHRLEYMAQELDLLKKELSEVKEMIKDMHTLLAGNPIDRDSNGLIGDFKSVKREVYELKAELKRYKSYFYAVLTLFSVGALKFIVDFLKAL